MSEQAPSNKESSQKPMKTRKMLAGAMAAGFLLPACASANADFPDRDPNPIACEADGEQEFTFEAGDGIRKAALAIEGSGRGEGDPCWAEAEEAVRDALTSNIPQYDETITIPEEVRPIEKQNE